MTQDNFLHKSVAQFRAYHDLRSQLEKKAAEIKAKELELGNEIIQYLDVQGFKNVRVEVNDQPFTVSTTTRDQAQIVDVEKLLAFMREELNTAAMQGKPLLDAMFFQQSAGLRACKAFVANQFPIDKTDTPEQKAAQLAKQNHMLEQMGVKIEGTRRVSLTKATKK